MTIDPEDADLELDGEPWTVGRLREALDNLPDEMPLTGLAMFDDGEIEDYEIIDAVMLSELVVEEIEPDQDELVLLLALRDEEDEDDADEPEEDAKTD